MTHWSVGNRVKVETRKQNLAIFINVSSKRAMTEGFLKPNAKTAFFSAILKFCTANQKKIIRFRFRFYLFAAVTRNDYIKQ